MLKTVLSATIAAGALFSAAQAQVTAANPQSIVTALQNLGYRAALSEDSSGDPKISTGVDGVNVSIYFYGCSNNANCTALQFVAGFNLTNGTTADSMNEWNRKKASGSAWIDSEGDPYLTYYFRTEDGVSQRNFKNTLSAYSTQLTNFKKHINW